MEVEMAAAGDKNEAVELNSDVAVAEAEETQNSRRERKVSPCLIVFPDHIPSPSSSSKDIDFEPTIDQMVNDFDDEQTLNEEEALGALEDAEEEIDTLKQESEIPIEELLAKYQSLPPIMDFVEPPRKKAKKSSSKKRQKSKQQLPSGCSDETLTLSHTHAIDVNECTKDLLGEDRFEEEDDEPVEEEESKKVENADIVKVRRTHLLDLYPEGTFGNVPSTGKDVPLETLFGVEDEEEEGAEEEDDEEYKKKVMIGSCYQAFIPKGLSQYGDILPYENEDKLIWEPSQVSELEVEAYLLKIRDINRNQGSEEETANSFESVNSANKEIGDTLGNREDIENNSLMANGEKKGNHQLGTADDIQAVVKDNEQALHLLVQCGYDFKEALRRKRLNALPMNDCMSLWSEEESSKFEEGIQKYGKDFLKIRQHQVRTRTMRELVQFYYLWKKTERRDHNFANTDTVDHMDIYLNEDNEYGSNPASVTTPVGSPVNSSSTSATRKNSQKNISIMTNPSTVVNNSPPLVTSLDKTCTSSQHKRRSNDSANSDCASTTSVVTGNMAGVTK